MTSHLDERAHDGYVADARPLTSPCVTLSWLPLGDGGTRIVAWSGAAFESVVAARAHRKRRDLYHSALQIAVDGDRYAIEMTPAWGRAKDADAEVTGGPVGLRALGRFASSVTRSTAAETA